MRYEPVPPKRCICLCHDGSIGDRHRADGVDVLDVIEAAVACDKCRKYHTIVLLSDKPANAPAPRVIKRRPKSQPWADSDILKPPPIPDDSSEDGG